MNQFFCHIFALICIIQLNFLSTGNPRYFTYFYWCILLEFIGVDSPLKEIQQRLDMHLRQRRQRLLRILRFD